MADRGTCRSCGAPILWARTANGRPMPLDPRPEKRVRLAGEGRNEFAEVVSTYVPHWATCPHAAAHRRAHP